MKANKKTNILSNQIIEQQAMSLVMANDFNRYAKAVLTDRAIPDVRDGMKPVQRRIIYGMYKQGIFSDKQTKKSATIVGFVMGHYHPHGDSSIYDALVRLSQDWKMEQPLVIMQGNNGSIDNDAPAASRYTEAKLAKIADLLVKDLDKDTVDMQLNFSDEEFEPTILPAYYPNLLVNGAQGIAVGTITSIPTHNLTEVIDATIYAIEHKNVTVNDLRKFILGPDFPTGGYINQKEALNKLYETGSASFYIYADSYIDSKTNQIIITSIPYGVVKSDFVSNLDNARINSNIANIEEIRDESAENIRIVIDVKKGQDCEPILSFFKKKGLLRTTFSANMLAIDKGHPRVLNLYDMINAFINHQIDVVTRRTKFDLNKSKKRLNILNGLIRCIDIIDEVIAVIKKSKGKAESKANIMSKFGFDDEQAEAIVMLNLYKINNLDAQAFIDEKNELTKLIADLEKILNDRSYLLKNIVSSLKTIKKEYPSLRKTQIKDEMEEIDEVDVTKLIAKEDVYVVLTKSGYIKRTNLRSYQASLDDDPLNNLPKLKPSDGTILNLKCSTHDGLIAFLASGNYIYIPIYQIPEAKWKEEGKHLSSFIKNMTSKDKVISAFIISNFEIDANFVLLTKFGKIKRTPIKDFEQKKLTPKPFKAMSLIGDDSLIKVDVLSNDSDILIFQSNGFVNRYNENEIPIYSTKSSGIKGVNLTQKDSFCTGLICLEPIKSSKDNEHKEQSLILIGDERVIKFSKTSFVKLTKRLGEKTQLVKTFNSSKANIIDVVKVDLRPDLDENLFVYSANENYLVKFNQIPKASLGDGFKYKAGEFEQIKEKIIGVHINSSIIDSSNLIIVKPTIKKDVKESEQETQQVTLFDMFEEEFKDK